MNNRNVSLILGIALLAFMVGLPVASEEFEQALRPALARVQPSTYYYVIICDGRYSTTERVIIHHPVREVELTWEPAWDLGCQGAKKEHQYDIQGTLGITPSYFQMDGFPLKRTVDP